MKIFISCLLISFAFSAEADTLKKATIVTIDIPPFMSPKMQHEGAAIHALRHIFKKAGYDLELRFVPVPRMRMHELQDKKVHGFFPSFKDEKFEQKMVHSKLFYRTPWVIVERKDKPILWKEPEDLLKYKGGNVAGYVLRSQVAKAYENNLDKLESAPNDSSNILKLIHGRVDFIFIDLNVFKFLVATNPDIKPLAKRLQTNAKTIVVNRYGVAFKEDRVGRKMLRDFNKYADEDEFTDIVNKYIEEQSHRIQPISL